MKKIFLCFLLINIYSYNFADDVHGKKPTKSRIWGFINKCSFGAINEAWQFLNPIKKPSLETIGKGTRISVEDTVDKIELRFYFSHIDKGNVYYDIGPITGDNYLLSAPIADLDLSTIKIIDPELKSNPTSKVVNKVEPANIKPAQKPIRKLESRKYQITDLDNARMHKKLSSPNPREHVSRYYYSEANEGTNGEIKLKVLTIDKYKQAAPKVYQNPDLSKLPPGTYIYVVTETGEVLVSKTEDINDIAGQHIFLAYKTKTLVGGEIEITENGFKFNLKAKDINEPTFRKFYQKPINYTETSTGEKEQEYKLREEIETKLKEFVQKKLKPANQEIEYTSDNIIANANPVMQEMEGYSAFKPSRNDPFPIFYDRFDQ